MENRERGVTLDMKKFKDLRAIVGGAMPFLFAAFWMASVFNGSLAYCVNKLVNFILTMLA